MKYLLITVVIGSQTIIYEVSDKLIYRYTLDSHMKEAYLIDRMNDTIFTFHGKKIKKIEDYPNKKNLGWSSGSEEILNHEILEDDYLGSLLKLSIAKKISHDSYPFPKDRNHSKFNKIFISKDSKFIQKYFYTRDELECRIFTWNNYINSDNFPFHVGTEQVLGDNDTIKIVNITFEEKTIDRTYRTSKMFDIVKKHSSNN